jgi:ABC-type bacteriocin/lantibiotic exporter with double-glycine peptidase domain
VGPSGAGKSTFIDLLLGLSSPSQGEILLDKTPLEKLISQWRKRVGYVPQRVSLFNGTISQNVALTWGENIDYTKVKSSLLNAQLDEFITAKNGMYEMVGERGDLLSGGQQQRLGIARALYSDPLVLVLDEATSSLDTDTENRVVTSLRELHGKITFITVAHRLSTIREYDQVCYLDKGLIIGVGTFDEVVNQVPDFALQARLAGLL